jgi:hypothetical protein
MEPSERDSLYEGVDAQSKLLEPIAYKDPDLNLPWESFDLSQELTTKGIRKFVADSQSTLKRSAQVACKTTPNPTGAAHPFRVGGHPVTEVCGRYRGVHP